MPVVAFPGMPGPASPADDRATVAGAVARLTAAGGTRHPVAALDCDHYATVMDHWAAVEPATWNRHLSALVSFTTRAQRQDLLATNPARRLAAQDHPPRRPRLPAGGAVRRRPARTP
ncbi:hypothetical protein [Nonomuraea bangladeshensis]|uniref:hypothetical protein n=1 Tax=Nonomuraea bangladeshensis TaxID=404385 RepID=UPI0031D9BC16